MIAPELIYRPVDEVINASLLQSLNRARLKPGAVCVLGAASDPEFILVYDHLYDDRAINLLPDILTFEATDPLVNFVSTRLKDRFGIIAPPNDLSIYPGLLRFTAETKAKIMQKHVRFLATGVLRDKKPHPLEMKPHLRPYGVIATYLEDRAQEIEESGGKPDRFIYAQAALRLYGRLRLGLN